MDDKAALALWEGEGTSLLPDAPPIGGKSAIARFLTRVRREVHGAHMQHFGAAGRALDRDSATGLRVVR